MTKLIVFDKDGVILDLEATWLPVACAVAHYTASRIPADWTDNISGTELLKAIGVDEATGTIDSRGIFAAGSFAEMRDCWQAMLPDHMIRLDQDQQYRHDVKALVARHGRQNTVSKGDVVTPLRNLYDAGYALAVLTNDNESSARDSLDDLDVHGLFCAVIGADSGFGAKPAGAGFLQCCHIAGVKPADAVMVGDTLADYGAAKAAHAGGFIAVADGFELRPHQDIGADEVIARLDELPALMRRRSAKAL